MIYEDKLPTSGYATFTAALKAFLSKVQGTEKYPTHVCIGIAGPRKGNLIKITNAPWPEFDVDKVKEEMKFVQFHILNDFEANGYGILAMKPEMYSRVTEEAKTPIVKGKPKICLGTGTGLGECILTKDPDKTTYVVYPGEGGHVDFAAKNALELGLLEHVRKKIKGVEHVSIERVCCGLAIPIIYDYLHGASKEADTKFHEAIKAPLGELLSILAVNPDDSSINERIDKINRLISNAGLEKQDPICIQTIEMFANLYGAETGNTALKILPYGGIYLMSTITQVLKKFIMTEPTFMVDPSF